MKKTAIILVIATSFFWQGCLKDKITHTYSIFQPIYKSKAEVFADIKTSAPRDIQTPGKLVLYSNYIFLNDVNRGIHIIDNTDPGHPVKKGFIEIPGNIDLAIRGNTLYADLYSEMVVVDISNPLQAKFIEHIPDIFPSRFYGNGFMANADQFIVDWTRKDTTVDATLQYYQYGLLAPSSSGVFAAAAPATIGITGSTARFAIVNTYLYAVNVSSLVTFDISNGNDPQMKYTTPLAWNIETIYPFQDKLFIGSSNGVYIFGLSNPAEPYQEGQFAHVSACDPVIADGQYAYVTLHDGTKCSGYQNELDVVSVNSLTTPRIVKNYPMTSPHGLAKDNNQLFICDGRAGLKVYDASNPGDITLKQIIAGIEPSDVIAWNKNLIVVTTNGLYQYDYSNPFRLKERSRLSINR